MNYRIPIDEIPDERLCFYDIETTHQYAPYTRIQSISVAYGMDSEPQMVDSPQRRLRFRRFLANPRNFCVAFNSVNFDNIVLERFGYPVGAGRQDLFFGIKTVASELAAFSLKFINFFYFGDPHFPEGEVLNWMQETGKDMWEAPPTLLHPYNKHDVVQTRNVFRLIWDVLIRDEFWNQYRHQMKMSEPLMEMTLEGGLYLSRRRCWKRLQRLQKKMQLETHRTLEITNGKVLNPGSSKQVGAYLVNEDRIELEMSDDGNFSVPKRVIVSLRDRNPLAMSVYKYREAQGSAKFMENYLTALDDPLYIDRDDWIPGAWNVSAARTRRFTSSSYHGLNFQNPNKICYQVQQVPRGFLGCWFDATSIENIVHIHASEDEERRRAYEEDPDWSEYVWLCNTILGGERSKEELDSIPSPEIPNWSIYKQYKTGKLALNFGMGLDKFAILFGLRLIIATKLIAEIHEACPAIKSLQHKARNLLRRQGYVEDVFGFRYSGPEEKAYKVVAYWIQGCGTGTLPQAQIRANWQTYRSFDRFLKRGSAKAAICNGTTHDENGCWIDLRLGPDRILQLLQKMNYNMTAKFSPRFDGIPLRAKMYLSRIFKSDREELSITDEKRILELATR